MRVGVKADLCQGHGRCFAIAPGVFASDDLGSSVVLGDGVVAVDDEAAARLASENCPEQAIWTED